jgi:hypothetical protein
MAAGDRLVVLTERGALLIAQATPDAYRELAAAKGVLPKTCWAPPVLANGRILAYGIPGAKLHVVEGGGHLFLHTSAHEVAPVIDEFLG